MGNGGRNKESVKVTNRHEVKRVLRKYDRQAKTVELLLEQAPVLSDGWALAYIREIRM